MTYDEWVRQIHRELESRVPLELVKDIMNNAMRVAFEELYSNPAEADLNIVGIGRFYLNRRICHNNFPTKDHPEYAPAWTIHFKVSPRMKEVFNGKKDPRELFIAHNIPMYPEYIYNEDGTVKKGFGTRRVVKNYKRKYTVKTHESYQMAYKRAQREALKKSLPQEEDE